MDWLPTWVIILLPMLGLLLHELTHLSIAKHQGANGVELVSTFPVFRLGVNYPDPPSSRQLRVMAIAPLLIGIVTGLVAYISGLWASIRHSQPYYLHVIVGLSWLCYTHASPADLRTAWRPEQYLEQC